MSILGSIASTFLLFLNLVSSSEPEEMARFEDLPDEIILQVVSCNAHSPATHLVECGN